MIYREDDFECVVDIVEDTSDDEWERYKLKIVQVLNKSRIYVASKVGEVFDVCWRKDCGNRCWYLRED